MSHKKRQLNLEKHKMKVQQQGDSLKHEKCFLESALLLRNVTSLGKCKPEQNVILNS